MDEVNPNRAMRISTLREQGQENDWQNTSVEQRWAAMWQLALDAWAMNGEPVVEQRPGATCCAH